MARKVVAGIGANPIARAIAALLLFSLSVGGLTLTAYTDQLVNGGVTWAPLPADWKPIPYTDVNPMGINLFLEKEVEPENITRTLSMVKEGGFEWARQGFAWNDIEISAKGNYTDTRNPGEPVDAWAKYDRIVDAYNRFGIEIIARLDSPPVWARKPGADVEQFHKGPPNDNEDYGDFAAAVANRYKGKIRYFQIWNEPNLYGEWGGEPVNAAAYTELLKVAHRAIKRVNPQAVIITSALAPTADDSVANQNDILFLEALYRAGAAPYFDIFSTMLYGLGQSPNERRTDLKRLNFSRPILLRQVMERNGDGRKPIWISEYAWISLPPDFPGDPTRNIWGESVDEETQARWLVEGYERARREWPWMGVMNVWYFREPEPKPEEPANYFAIVNHDYTPRPAYNALKAYSERLREETSSQVVRLGYQEDILDMDVEGGGHGRFGTFTETLGFTGGGLDVALCRFCSVRVLEVDGEQTRFSIIEAHSEGGREADMIPLLRNLPDGAHTVEIQGTWGTLLGDGKSEVVYRAVSRSKPPEKPLWNAWGYPLVYGIFGLFALASATFGLLSVGRWAGAALNIPRGRYTDDVRKAARNGAAAMGMFLLLGAYYLAGSVPAALAALVGWLALAYVKPQIALAFVAAAIPFFWIPKEIGAQKFPPAETLLLVTFAAVVLRYAVLWGLPEARRRFGRMARAVNEGRSEAAPGWRSRFAVWNRVDPFAPPAVALLLLGSLSLLFLADTAFAKDSFRAYRWVIVEPVLFYFLVTDVVKSRRGLIRLADFFVGAAVVVALIGLWQYAQNTNLVEVEGVKRIQSVYQHPNNLALFLGRVTPFAACIAIFLPWGWRKALYGLASLPLAGALVLTFSRGALAAVAAAMVVVAVVGWRVKSSKSGEVRGVKPAWAAGALAGVALLAAAAVVLVPLLPPRLLSVGSGVLRLEIWGSALEMVRDRPVTGVGIDQFLNQFQMKDGEGKYVYLPEGFQESFTSHPHNLILDSWLSLGIMGVPLFLWLLWRFGRTAFTRIRGATQRGDPTLRGTALGLLASMTVFTVHGLVDSSYFLMDLAMIFWLSCGMLAVSADGLEGVQVTDKIGEV